MKEPNACKPGTIWALCIALNVFMIATITRRIIVPEWDTINITLAAATMIVAVMFSVFGAISSIRLEEATDDAIVENYRRKLLLQKFCRR